MRNGHRHGLNQSVATRYPFRVMSISLSRAELGVGFASQQIGFISDYFIPRRSCEVKSRFSVTGLRDATKKDVQKTAKPRLVVALGGEIEQAHDTDRVNYRLQTIVAFDVPCDCGRLIRWQKISLPIGEIY